GRTAGIIGTPCDDRSHTGGRIGFDLGQRRLNQQAAIPHECLRISLDEMRRIGKTVLSTKNFAVVNTNAASSKRGRIETGNSSRGGRCALHIQFAFLLSRSEYGHILSVRRDGGKNARE